MGILQEKPFEWWIKSAFATYPPDPDRDAQRERIRVAARDLAILIRDSTPAGSVRETRASLERLQEAVMWAEAAIVRGRERLPHER